MAEDISNVKVHPLTGFGNLKAMASLNFKGVILKGIRLMEKDNSLWLGMPSRKRGEQWEDIFFFPDTEVRQDILDRISALYRSEGNN